MTNKAELKEKILTPSPEEIARERAWMEAKIEEVGAEKIDELIQVSIKVRENAYEPYSGYEVGSAIRCKSGAIYSSCNAEVCDYTGTDHAETGAISFAIKEGEYKRFGASFLDVLVVCHPEKSGPCGGCRQRIAEHCENALILDVYPDGNIKAVTSLKLLFPYAFVPSHVK